MKYEKGFFLYCYLYMKAGPLALSIKIVFIIHLSKASLTMKNFLITPNSSKLTFLLLFSFFFYSFNFIHVNVSRFIICDVSYSPFSTVSHMKQYCALFASRSLKTQSTLFWK